jgi:hypothetical protein
MKGAPCAHNTGWSEGHFTKVEKHVAIIFIGVRFLYQQLATPWLHQLLFISAVMSMMCVLNLVAHKQKMIKRAEASSVASSGGKKIRSLKQSTYSESLQSQQEVRAEYLVFKFFRGDVSYCDKNPCTPAQCLQANVRISSQVPSPPHLLNLTATTPYKVQGAGESIWL